MEANETITPVLAGMYNAIQVQEILANQAEISFKAGIKEVLEWSNETCPHDLFGEGTQCFKRACDLCWWSKLKEWGIE